MPRYADPTRCPDCTSPLPVAPRVCPSCGLPLVGPLVDSLFATLQRADSLLVDLRATAAPARPPAPPFAPPAPMPPVVPTPPPTPAGSLPQAPVTPYAPRQGTAGPLPHPPPAPQGGIGLGAVPKILLGLGGLCLIVGAITFLAMAWDALGVGGRTLTLVAFTLAAGAGAAELGRRRLRIGAESLTTVALGLLALDVVGAVAAGWFGDVGAATTTALTGGVVAAASVAVFAVTSLGERRPLTAPQVGATIALHVAGGGLLGAVDGGWSWVLAGTAVCFTLLALVGRLGRTPSLTWAGLTGAGVWWLGLFGYAAVRLASADEFDLATLVGDAVGGPMALAALLLLLLPLAVRPPATLHGALTGVSAVLLSATALLAAVDESDLVRTLVVSAVVLLLTATVLRARDTFATWATRTAAIGIWPSAALLALLAVGRAWAGVWADADPFSRSATTLTQPPSGFGSPLLTLVLAVAVLALPAVLARRALGWSVPDTALRIGALASIAVVVTVALYAVPLLAALVVCLVLDVAWTVVALRRGDATLLGLTGFLSGASLFIALPSDACAALTFAVWTALTALAARTGRGGVAVSALALLPVPATLTVWSLAHVVDAPVGVVPLVVLVVVAPLPLVRPALATEVSALSVFALSSLFSLGGTDRPMSWLAAHLAGLAVACAASAFLHAERRSLAWVGGVCLALAAWLRMADLGVDTAEAYTLPAALVLLVLGAELMRRNQRLSSVTGLLVGLLLAVLPSLVIVLGDTGPMGWRGGLLATACLAMVVAGVSLRLSTPLVVGATVGVILALRLLGPVASDVPTFVWLGTAGVLLTVMGITWEARLANLRATGAYLARLR